jgi:hypothetical protein
MEHPEVPGIVIPNTVNLVMAKDELNYYTVNKSRTRWIRSNLPVPRDKHIMTNDEYSDKYAIDGVYSFCKIQGRASYFTSLEHASDYADANGINEVFYINKKTATQ